jgi:aspartate/methionine/tyrosine aminotransferase
VAALGKLAQALPGGVVDCSIGTPCDPPPAGVVEALSSSGSERGYPASAGSPALIAAAAAWLERRFGLPPLPLTSVAACVGTKELVASVPHVLRLRHPGRDTVLYPSVSYPTYAMGAALAGCRAVPVPPLPGHVGGLDLGSIAQSDAARALVLWSNSPSNPTGGLGDLGAEAEWGRARGVPVFSDECYAEFTWADRARTILEAGPDGVVAVHSLSKRSNLAGMRVGSYSGDGELVTYLAEVRRHAGLMVPGPAQAAAVVALGDDSHVDAQREIYRSRLAFLAETLREAGIAAQVPAGSFYLWVGAPAGIERADEETPGWALARFLAERGGVLASPGELYGPGGDAFARLAVVQPFDRLELVAKRLAGSSISAG